MFPTLSSYFNMFTELEFLLLGFLFSWNHKKRDRFALRTCVSSLVAVLLAFPTQYLEALGKDTNVYIGAAAGALNYSLLFLYGMMVLFFCFDIKPSQSFFMAVLANNLRHLIYLTWQLVNYIVSDCLGKDPFSYHWTWIVIAVSLVILYLPLLFRFYKTIRDFPDFALAPNSLLYFSFFALFINVLLNLFVIQTDFTDLPNYLKYVINLFNILGCVLILMVMVGFVSRLALQEEVSAVNQMRHEEEKQYQISKENIDLINIKCHDLRHQIRRMGESGGEIRKEEIQRMEEVLRIYDTRIQTGNPSLDLILQEKSLICSKENIVFNCIIDGKSLSFMDEGEIYSLFGNIVDNAIESSKKIQNSSERVITLKIKRVADGVFCYEENRYVGKLDFKDGLPVTTNNDRRYHGYGMKSIRMTVNRYHGTLDIQSDGQRFRLSIFFPESA